MKTIVIPDLHCKVAWVEEFLKNQEYDEVVFLGDYFDRFYEQKEQTERTAQWLKESLNKPNRVHLFGNHDIWYSHPMCEGIVCSGNSYAKCEVINNIMDMDDWNKLTLFHYSQNFYYSHAGLSRHHFEHPVHGITLEHIKNVCDDALKKLCYGETSPILMAGMSRGGPARIGGITWQDWREFEPIPHINQIVGHTCDYSPRTKHCPNKKDSNSYNLCIDTNCRFLAQVIDGKVDVIDNPILGSW